MAGFSLVCGLPFGGAWYILRTHKPEKQRYNRGGLVQQLTLHTSKEITWENQKLY